MAKVKQGRPPLSEHPALPRDEIFRLYCLEKVPYHKIAQKYGFSAGGLRYWMDKYGIQRRSRSEVKLLVDGRRVKEKTCLVCGRKFEVRLSQIGLRGGGKYCSKECQKKARRNRIVRKCLNCGQSFSYIPSQTGRMFCSQKCQYAYAKKGEVRYCVVCGKAFYARRGEIKRSSCTHCSRECMEKDEKLKRDRLLNVHQKAKRKPNKLERWLSELMQNEGLPYKYVGDGSVVLNGLNPDFINANGKKKLIELFGDHFHKEAPTWHQTELGRMMAYNSLGFDCLVIWEHELKNDPDGVLAKIKKWDKKKSKKRG